MHPWWPHVLSFPRFLDPLSWFWSSTKGYAFTSSGLQITIPVAFLVWLRAHNCHHPRCPWLAWHPHPEHGHPVCRRHYGQDGHPDLIAAEHDRSKPTKEEIPS